MSCRQYAHEDFVKRSQTNTTVAEGPVGEPLYGEFARRPPPPAPNRNEGSLAKAKDLSEVYSLRLDCCRCRLSDRICSVDTHTHVAEIARAHAHTHTHSFIFARAHTHTHTHIHICVRAHTHIHAHTKTPLQPRKSDYICAGQQVRATLCLYARKVHKLFLLGDPVLC